MRLSSPPQSAQEEVNVPETSRNRLVERFLTGLRQELDVEGVPSEKRSQIVEEARNHLAEAIEVSKPVNDDQVRKVIQEFGSQRKLARSLAAEYRHADSKRLFLWPAALAVAALAALYLIKTEYRLWLFGDLVWMGSIYLGVVAIALFALGARARKPLFGQFVALALGLVAAQTSWYAITSYPVAHGEPGKPQWYEPVGRSEVARSVVQFRQSIAEEKEIARRLAVGELVFSGKTRRQAPDFLRYGQSYLLPEGIREMTLGIPPAKLHSSLMTPSWKDAVSEWNKIRYFGNMKETDWIISQVPKDVARSQYSIDFLGWIQRQPLSVQLADDLRMVMPTALNASALAAIATNLGWMFGFLARQVGRLLRRTRYGPNRLAI
jgi:hypothetical protein